VKIYVRIFVAASAFLLILSSISMPVKAATTYGPRIGELLCKIYGTDIAEFAAFDAGEIDLVDSPLTKDLVTKYTGDPTVTLDSYRENGMYQFDINNNLTMLSYPNWRSPTSYPEFRHAIAHMIDKPFIITNILGGFGAQMEVPVMPWTRWYDLSTPLHPYSPATACQILRDAGWRNSADPNVVEDVHFPPGHEKAGLLLKDWMVTGPHGAGDPGLIFYRRSDKVQRAETGRLLIYGGSGLKGLEDIGIPVDDNLVARSVCSPNVMYKKDFHLYTGGWSLGRDPDLLYDLYNGRYMDWDITVFAQNYCNINDPAFNEYSEKVKFAKDFDVAQTNSYLACQRWGQMVFMFPLWTTAGYMAHKWPWHALNVDSYGVRDWWNLEAIHNPEAGPTGGQLKWGFKSDIEMLNVIYSQSQWDWQILDKLFDSLIKFNPLNIALDMPWMASSWTAGTWTNPDTGQTASKITYTLGTGIKWINPITGTVNSAVTPQDVAFSFQYVYDQAGWNYPSVADLYVNPDGSLKIEIIGNTLTFYESIASVWALHWIGGLPIIPKSVYELIPDARGFYPGGVYPDTLMGSGNFYFSSYTAGVSCLLTANRNYWKTIVPDRDTDPLMIAYDWAIFRANVRSGDWTVSVADGITVVGAFGWTGPPGNIPEDINKDGKVDDVDLSYVLSEMGAAWPGGGFVPGGPEVSVTNLVTCKDGGLPKPTLCQRYTACVNVTVNNLWGYGFGFEVSIYANSTRIGSQRVYVGAQESTVVSFTWDPQSFAIGYYVLRAEVPTAYPAEHDKTDNSIIGGGLTVSKAGDVRCDGQVNVLDLILVAMALNLYNPTADIRHDHVINVLDLIAVATNLDQS